MEFCVDFEDIIEGVHFNFAREVAGQYFCHNVAIGEVSEGEEGTTLLGSRPCR